MHRLLLGNTILNSEVERASSFCLSMNTVVIIAVVRSFYVSAIVSQMFKIKVIQQGLLITQI